MLGLRDIDPPEAEILKEHHIRYYKWDYIMEHGLQNCLNESIDYLSTARLFMSASILIP